MRRLVAAGLSLWLIAIDPVAADEPVTTVPLSTWTAADGEMTADTSHELELHVYTFRGTRWSADMISSAVADSARLLRPCGVAVTRIEMHLIDAPRRFHFYHAPHSRTLMRAIEPRRPALFFVEDTLNRPAFDAEAIGLANARGRSELANTIWVAYGARDLPYAIGHELVHVLSDSGEHSSESGNLMRPETGPHNTRLDGAQCARLRARGTANGLLKAR